MLTGAAGRIGRTVGERLEDRWELRRTDLPGTEVPGHDVTPLDVTDAEGCVRLFRGADAVVHLGAVPDPEAGWDELLPANVVGVHAVVTAAVRAGVGRLVLASSLQALSAYAHDVQLRPTDPPRPANLYGATKAWAEALGAWAASSSSVEVVALRIGYFDARPPGEDVTPRERAAWLSPADATRLVVAAVEGPVQGFTVVDGISANRYRRASLGAAEAALGYEPQDDAWAGPGPTG